MRQLKDYTEFKLREATTVTLIVDFWTTDSNRDFLGLAAVVTNKKFEKEIICLGMIRMAGMINQLIYLYNICLFFYLNFFHLKNIKRATYF
jgi:hypothetical protein